MPISFIFCDHLPYRNCPSDQACLDEYKGMVLSAKTVKKEKDATNGQLYKYAKAKAGEAVYVLSRLKLVNDKDNIYKLSVSCCNFYYTMKLSPIPMKPATYVTHSITHDATKKNRGGVRQDARARIRLPDDSRLSANSTDNLNIPSDDAEVGEDDYNNEYNNE
jgi:hypothetical protein